MFEASFAGGEVVFAFGEGFAGGVVIVCLAFELGALFFQEGAFALDFVAFAGDAFLVELALELVGFPLEVGYGGVRRAG